MEKTIIKFGDIEIEKQKFTQHKRPISIKNIDINKIVLLNKASFGKNDFKYFIGYKDAKMKKILMKKILIKKLLIKKIKNRKTDKIFLNFFFLYIKTTNNYYQEKQRKA